MNAVTIMQWVAKYPGLLAILGKFPNLNPGTTDLLLAYLKKTVEQDDPEAFLVNTLRAALTSKVTVVVESQRALPKRGK